MPWRVLQKLPSWLVVEPTHLKNITQVGIIVPKVQDEHKTTYLNTTTQQDFILKIHQLRKGIQFLKVVQ